MKRLFLLIVSFGLLAGAAPAHNGMVHVSDVILGLKIEYREAIQQVDLDGRSVQDFAASQETSANNASVRLHRARKDRAKKLISVCGACAEHKSLDCTCRRSQL